MPIDELIELTKTNTQMDTAKQTIKEINYSMNLLEADLVYCAQSHIERPTPWTVAHQAPLSMEFSRKEYCSG